MGMIISVYTHSHFEEYLLPLINNSDYGLPVLARQFGIARDVNVHLEVIENVWRIVPENHYKLYREGSEIVSKEELEDGKTFQLITVKNERMMLFVRRQLNPFNSWIKYDLSKLQIISIGANPNNTIVYQYQSLISDQHAVMERTGRSWVIRNMGRNGIYINSSFVCTQKELSFGDLINLYGLHLIFLTSVLAVDMSVAGERARPVTLKPALLKKECLHAKTAETAEQETPERQVKYLYHRAPRMTQKIETDPVEIEAPPQAEKRKDEPFLSLIGSGLTMVIPSLLSCVILSYASRGVDGSGLYMYSGLAMSVSSALAGVILAWTGLQNRKKTGEKEKAHRFEAYSGYLMDKADEIRNKYDSNIAALKKMYPDTVICASYDQSSPQLWNRNPTHKDYLVCRIGTGNVPSPVEILIPKEKFVLDKDPLYEKPQYIRDSYAQMIGVPVLTDLKSHAIIGIAGGKEKRGAFDISRVLAVQLAAVHCYTDVKMAFLSNASVSADAGEWDAFRWLPHVWSEDGRSRYVAQTPQEASDVCYELTKVLRERAQENTSGNGSPESRSKPHIVIFLSDASLLEGELLAKYVYMADKNLGLSAVILADTCEHLPNACQYIIQNTSEERRIYNASAVESEIRDITFDHIDREQVETFARKLSNIEVSQTQTGGEIPVSLTFFEMYGVSGPEELEAAQRWRKNRTYENIKGLIGQKAGGVPCYLDVHEKYHGPHGLIAGTTGSGKSETLQTYILSLAISYSPDDVVFFLIDYKGGGMAHLFDGLPHLAGQISNLSGNQVHRAMISIKSENRRRQRIFNENGVNHIDAYTKLVKSGEVLEPVPHLFIIIDEFAELKKEEPDFMRELISVAQVGRSLGVHLILATQKPGGTVDDNIWSNSKFRLCLRVQDKADSLDMLHRPDAAYITRAGRCYLQVGSDEVFELFQSGWSGAPYDAQQENVPPEIAIVLNNTGKADAVGTYARTQQKNEAVYRWIGRLTDILEKTLAEKRTDLQALLSSPSEKEALLQSLFRRLEEEKIEYPINHFNCERLENFVHLYQKVQKEGGDRDKILAMIHRSSAENMRLPVPKDHTQLDAVIDYLAREAAREGYQHHHSLWMPLLPERIYLSDLSDGRQECFQNGRWKSKSGPWTLETPIGLADDPENQTRIPINISFSQTGHLAVIGSIASGKSTLLQTLLYAMITRYSPDELHVYAIDFSSKALTAFGQAPHTGGIVCEGEDKKISKLVHLLKQMLKERKTLLRGGNYSQYVQANGVTLPAVLLVIDAFGVFNQKTNHVYEEDVLALIKEGTGNGIFLVLSANEVSTGGLPLKMAENISTALCLQLSDRYAYCDVFHTMAVHVLPENPVKGRGLAQADGRILEFQTALSMEAADDYQRNEKIAGVCREMSRAWTGVRAAKIPEIPENPAWDEFALMEQTQMCVKSADLVPVGYDEESAQVYSINLRNIYCYMITGARRTGKRTFMKVMIASNRLRGDQVYIVNEGTDMNIYAGCGDVHFVRGADEIFEFFKNVLTPAFLARNQVKKALEAEGADEQELFDAAAGQEAIFIYLPRMVSFMETVYADERGMSGYLSNLFRKGRFHHIYFVGIVSLEERQALSGYSLFEDFISYRNGIHFGGNTSADDLLNFDYLGYSRRDKVLRPGIGQLPEVDGQHTAEQVVIPVIRRRK